MVGCRLLFVPLYVTEDCTGGEVGRSVRCESCSSGCNCQAGFEIAKWERIGAVGNGLRSLLPRSNNYDEHAVISWQEAEAI